MTSQARLPDELTALLVKFRESPSTSVIVTDVDGTIAPIVARPEAAEVLPEAIRSLKQLVKGYQGVGLLSGRGLSDLRRMANIPGAYYVGNHGIEMSYDGEDYTNVDLAVGLIGLGEAKRVLRTAIEVGADDITVEYKDYSVAIHYRLVDDSSRIEALNSLVEQLASAHDLHLLKGKKVFELQAGANGGKDLGMKAILDHVAQRTGTAVERVIFFGDDVTDIDAFEYLQKLRSDGSVDTMSVAVDGGSEQSPAVRQAARLLIESPRAVSLALGQLLLSTS